MSTELIDFITMILILAFVIGRGIALAQQWLWLNTITKDDSPDTRPQSQQVITPAAQNAMYVVRRKHSTGAKYDYEERVEGAV